MTSGVLLSALAICLSAGDAPMTIVADDAALRDALIARLARLQTIEIRYEQRDETLIKSGREVPRQGNVVMSPDEATREKVCRAVLYDGVVRYETEIKPAYHDNLGPDGIGEPMKEVRVITPEKELVLIRSAPGRKPFGNVNVPLGPLPQLIVDYALGTRIAQADPGWVREEMLRSAAISVGDDGRVVVESVRDNGGVDRWTFQSDQGLALVRYAHQWNGAEFEGHVVECRDFRKVDGVPLPFSITQSRFTQRGGAVRKRHVADLSVVSYGLSSPEVFDAIDDMPWVPGMTVYDTIRGEVMVVDPNGELARKGRPRGGSGPSGAIPNGDEDGVLYDGAPTTSAAGLSGWGAILGGLALGALALVVGRYRTGSVATALFIMGGWLALNIESNAAIADDDPFVKELKNVREAAQARQADRNEAERAHDRMVHERIVARLARDLALNEGQFEAVGQHCAAYRQADADRLSAYQEELKQWRNEYWLTRIPELDLNADISHLSGAEWLQMYGWRKSFAHGASPFTDAESERARLIESGNMLVALYLQQRDARRQLSHDIAAILNAQQRDRWPRAERRLQIALRDGGRPGVRNVNNNLDMIGMLEDAAGPEGELAALGDVLLDPLACVQDGKIEAHDAIDAALIQFEIAYLDTLETVDRRSHAKNRFKAEGGPTDSEARIEASKRWRRAMWRRWMVCLDFAEQLRAMALNAGLIDRSQGRQWEARVYRQCSPISFEIPDAVEALVEQLEELPEPLPADVAAAITEMQDAYEERRHRLCVDLARTRLEHYCTWGTQREQQVQKGIGLEADLDDVAGRTVRGIESLLDNRVPGWREVTAQESQRQKPAAH